MWRIEPFDRKRHHREAFDCGNAVLNDWFKTKPSQWEKKDLCRTYVAVDSQLNVAGYYTLSSHHVEHDSLRESQAQGLPRIDVPVVLLGRLAVDRRTQGQGVGTLLLLNALSRIAKLAETLGIRAVEVDAIDESAKHFYLKYGFSPLRDDERHLFLSVGTIQKLELPAPE